MTIPELQEPLKDLNVSATLIDVDNINSYGAQFVNRSGVLFCNEHSLFFDEYFQTSPIKEIDMDNDIIKIQTKNTLYTFKVLK